ncbi:Bardet-Biedl syndrome 1 protein [Rhizophlyctis rosea]|nr:Bardet-Biedl syndrome 1 protein [Rhizophlyctis rosea]
MDPVSFLLPPLTPTPDTLLATSAIDREPLSLVPPRFSTVHPLAPRKHPPSTTQKPEPKPAFLPALKDPLAGLHTVQSCLVTVDLSRKGEYDLVACQIPRVTKPSTTQPHAQSLPNPETQLTYTLRPYPPTLSTPPTPLPCAPSGLTTFPSRTPLHGATAHRPVIAVACGSQILIYESLSLPNVPAGLTLTFTFTLPPVHVDRRERDVWERMWEGLQSAWARSARSGGGARDEGGNVGEEDQGDGWMKGDRELVEVMDACVRELRSLRWEHGVKVTPRSVGLLSKRDVKEWVEVVKGCEGIVDHLPTITSLTTIKQSFDDTSPQFCLVVGTEEGILHVLDTLDFDIKFKTTLPHAIMRISTWGLLTIHHSIVAACMDGGVYRVDCNRPAPSKDSLITSTRYPIVGIVAFETYVVVATMDGVIGCWDYHKTLQFSIHMPSSITAITRFDHPLKSFHGYAVGMESGEVRVYQGREMIFVVLEPSPLSTLHILPYAREPLALLTTTRTGGISIKLLKRSASFEPIPPVCGPLEEERTPIPVPKRGRAWMEGVEREKRDAGDIWKKFEEGMERVRVRCAREFVRGVVEGRMGGEEGGVRVESEGKGPTFLLRLRITNISSKAVLWLRGVLNHDPTLVEVEDPVLEVPYMIPNVTYVRETRVTVRDEGGGEPNLSKSGGGGAAQMKFVEVVVVSVGGRKVGKPILRVLVELPT